MGFHGRLWDDFAPVGSLGRSLLLIGSMVLVCPIIGTMPAQADRLPAQLGRCPDFDFLDDARCRLPRPSRAWAAQFPLIGAASTSSGSRYRRPWSGLW